MPPPAAPSPHRFRPPRDSRSSHKRPSALRQALPPPIETRHDVSSSQFKPTPRFSVPALGHGANLTGSQFNRSIASGKQHFGPRLDRTDSIDDSSQPDGNAKEQGDPDDEMLFDTESREVVGSVESGHAPIPHAHGNVFSQTPRINVDFVDENPAKRRRLSLHAATPGIGPDQAHPLPRRQSLHQDFEARHDPSVLTQPAASPPHPTSPPRTTRPPRFKHTEATPSRAHPLAPTSTDPLPPPPTTTKTTSRPRNPFRLPPSVGHGSKNDPTAADATPLPEHFSPHRRNQKFVPGGMAETVRGWILGVGHGPDAARTSSRVSSMVVAGSREAVGENRLRLLAGKTDGDGEGEEARALLVGPAKGVRAGVAMGDEVKIAAPSWDVQVGRGSERRRWVVGVDWSVV
ncbi:hypothetical protein IWZ03DRAFT_376020 [Phyllosticta citriasiana]|uniref:Uncharacterized protein n=1 Tax=Phyllosticta citriasiana TaxID=595635 RepID=A0ABR1KLJ8_9PEZI